MRRFWRAGFLILFVCSALVVGLGSPTLGQAGPPADLRLGLVATLFRDFHKSVIEYVTTPLRSLLQTQTGLSGRLESTTDPLTLARQLQDNQVDIAIFHGFEFAWARQKYPQLQPLLLVTNPQPFQANLIVAKSSPFSTCDDLKGKNLALPRQSREHLHLFLERRCHAGKDPREYFGKIMRPVDADDALEMVASGAVQAALVDQAQLEAYSKSQPDNFGKLRVLLRSEIFPTGVIAYHPGALSAETVQRIRTGMTSAHKTAQGRDLLKLSRMAGFELPPADFDQILQTISRAYPPPTK